MLCSRSMSRLTVVWSCSVEHCDRRDEDYDTWAALNEWQERNHMKRYAVWVQQWQIRQICVGQHGKEEQGEQLNKSCSDVKETFLSQLGVDSTHQSSPTGTLNTCLPHKFFCFRNQTQDFVLVRQVLCHWATSPAPHSRFSRKTVNNMYTEHIKVKCRCLWFTLPWIKKTWLSGMH